MEITKITNYQGDFRVEIKFKSGKMLAGIINPGLAWGIIRMADEATLYKVGDHTTYEFEFGQQPVEPQLWYDEDLTPSEEEPAPKPLPNTFTWEEMDDAFQAGANYGAAEPGTRPDFGAFMDGLGASKSMP